MFSYRNLFVFVLLGLLVQPVWILAEDEKASEEKPVTEEQAEANGDRRPAGLWEVFFDNADSESSPEEIVVTASRLRGEGIAKSRIPAGIAVITKTQLRDSHTRTVADYLERELGIVSFDLLGNGRQKTIDLRGFNDGLNTVVMVDGVVQNRSDDNSVNWANIPVENIERIEVLRGSASIVAGRGASGGVVNIITSRPSDQRTVTAGMEAGEHKYKKFFVGTSGSWKNVRATTHRILESGASKLSDSAFRRRGTWTKVGLEFNNADIYVTHTYERSVFQQPSSKTRPQIDLDRYDSRKARPDYARFDLHQFQADFNWDINDAFSLNLTGFSRDQDSKGIIHFPGAGLDSRISEEAKGITLQVVWNYSNEFLDNIFTIGGDSSKWEYQTTSYSTDGAGNWQFSAFNPVPGFISDQRELKQHVFGFYVQDNVKLWDRITLSGGIRGDESKIDFANDFLPAQDCKRTFYENTYSLGMVADLPWDLQIYALRSEGYRIPAIFELFTFGGFAFNDNPLLNPEKTRNQEVGARWHYRDIASAEIGYYESETKDDIQFVATGQFAGQNENVGTISQSGFEAAGRLRLTANLAAWANFTTTRAFFTKGEIPRGNWVPLVPEYVFAMGTSLEFWKYFNWNTDMRWVSSRRMDLDQMHVGPRWDGFTIVNSQLTARYQGFEAFARVNNMFDEHHESWAVWNAFSAPPQPFYVIGPERNFSIGISYSKEF
ncbi:TonB-dependent receptor [Planctomycetota bacterium]